MLTTNDGSRVPESDTLVRSYCFAVSAFGSPYEGKIDYEIASPGRQESAEPKDNLKLAVLDTDDNEIFTNE